MSRRPSVIPIERLASRIYLIRGEKVMLDSDLAELYAVQTGALVRAVKRNVNRFQAISRFNSARRSSTT